MQQPVTIQLDISDHLDDFRRGLAALPNLTEADAVAVEKLKREFLAALPGSIKVEKPASEAGSECGNG